MCQSLSLSLSNSNDNSNLDQVPNQSVHAIKYMNNTINLHAWKLVSRRSMQMRDIPPPCPVRQLIKQLDGQLRC